MILLLLQSYSGFFLKVAFINYWKKLISNQNFDVLNLILNVFGFWLSRNYL